MLLLLLLYSAHATSYTVPLYSTPISRIRALAPIIAARMPAQERTSVQSSQHQHQQLAPPPTSELYRDQTAPYMA